MSEPYLGIISSFPYNFAPRGWAFCNGQLLPIAQNTALFSLLGTTFGGNGQTTFALPDLRGRAAISAGQGPGLQPYTLGEDGGAEAVTVTTNQMPAHSHTAGLGTLAAKARGASTPGNSRTPVGTVPAVEAAGVTATNTNAAADSNMAAGALVLTGSPDIGVAGGSQPHENMQPYLVINYCIALEGIFPSPN